MARPALPCYYHDLLTTRMPLLPKAFEATAWHEVPEDATFKKEATSLGVEPRLLLALNTARLKGLTLSSLLLKGTTLQVEDP